MDHLNRLRFFRDQDQFFKPLNKQAFKHIKFFKLIGNGRNNFFSITITILVFLYLHFDPYE